MASYSDPMDVPEAAEWRESFDPTPGLYDFVFQNISIAKAFAVMRLLWPQYVEERGCVLIQEHFSEETFERWWLELNGDIPRVEGMINHVHLWDLFNLDQEDERTGSVLDEMAELIAASWRCSLANAFPNSSFEVSLSISDEEEYGPTVSFWSIQ